MPARVSLPAGRVIGRSITGSALRGPARAGIQVRVPARTAREELRAQVSAGDQPASRNALDLHIKRLRRRIQPLGLSIRTAWGRGYILEAE